MMEAIFILGLGLCAIGVVAGFAVGGWRHPRPQTPREALRELLQVTEEQQTAPGVQEVPEEETPGRPLFGA